MLSFGPLELDTATRLACLRHGADAPALPAGGFDEVAGVARGVAVGGHGLDAAEVDLPAEGLEFAGGLVGRGGIPGHLEERLEAVRRLGGDVFRQPEIVVGLGDPDVGIGEQGLAVGAQQARRVVRVQVGQQHHVHLLGAVAGGLEVVTDETQGGAEGLGGAGVNEDQLSAGVHQEGIDRRLDFLTAQEHAGQQALDFGRAGVVEQLGVEIDEAIVQGRDFHITHGEPVVAGHLGTDSRGFGQGGGGGDKGSAEGQGKGQAGEAVTNHGAGSSSEKDIRVANYPMLASGRHENGQPDRVRARGGHPVAPPRRDQQPVTGGEEQALTVVELKLGTALGEHDPFIVGLVVPETRRAGVLVGDDAFDAQPGSAQQRLDVFIRAGGGEWREKVVEKQRGRPDAGMHRRTQKRLRRDEVSVGFLGVFVVPRRAAQARCAAYAATKRWRIIRCSCGEGQLKVGMHCIVRPYRAVSNNLPKMGVMAARVSATRHTLGTGG